MQEKMKTNMPNTWKVDFVGSWHNRYIFFSFEMQGVVGLEGQEGPKGGRGPGGERGETGSAGDVGRVVSIVYLILKQQ